MKAFGEFDSLFVEISVTCDMEKDYGEDNQIGFGQSYKIYLIVHGHQLNWLPGLMDALRAEMKDVVKQWNIRDSNVKVFNEQTALENHIIVAYVPVAEIGPLKLPNGNPDDAKVLAWFKAHEEPKAASSRDQ